MRLLGPVREEAKIQCIVFFHSQYLPSFLKSHVYYSIYSHNLQYYAVSALAKMNYTKACQMEAMRINPVALGSIRLLDRDTSIGGYKVPVPSIPAPHHSH